MLLGSVVVVVFVVVGFCCCWVLLLLFLLLLGVVVVVVVRLAWYLACDVSESSKAWNVEVGKNFVCLHRMIGSQFYANR